MSHWKPDSSERGGEWKRSKRETRRTGGVAFLCGPSHTNTRAVAFLGEAGFARVVRASTIRF